MIPGAFVGVRSSDFKPGKRKRPGCASKEVISFRAGVFNVGFELDVDLGRTGGGILSCEGSGEARGDLERIISAKDEVC